MFQEEQIISECGQNQYFGLQTTHNSVKCCNRCFGHNCGTMVEETSPLKVVSAVGAKMSGTWCYIINYDHNFSSTDGSESVSCLMNFGVCSTGENKKIKFI